MNKLPPEDPPPMDHTICHLRNRTTGQTIPIMADEAEDLCAWLNTLYENSPWHIERSTACPDPEPQA